jgi:acyl-coenzyme A thioesterase PaaI-like protein
MAEQVLETTEQRDGGAVEDDGHCFGCGEKNPIGLHLHFDQVDNGVRAFFTAGPQYQGYVGLLHGGLAATLIDEAIAWAVMERFGPAMTAYLDVRHRHPIPVGAPLIVSARIVKRRLSMVEGEGRIAQQDGMTLAEGHAKFMLVKPTSGMISL